MERAIEALKKQGIKVNPDWYQYLSPLGWEHINLTGDYIWHQNKVANSGLCAQCKILNGVYIPNSVLTLYTRKRQATRRFSPPHYAW